MTAVCADASLQHSGASVDRALRRLARAIMLWASVFIWTAHHVAAAGYPTHPITMVIPYAAGGPSDEIGRLLATTMEPALRQTIVVMNVGGAGGNVGASRVAHAAPDGYTLLLTNSSIVTSPALYPRLDYSVVHDLQGIGMVAVSNSVLAGRENLPPSDFKGLVAYIKRNGGNATFGTSGVGAPTDLYTRLLLHALGAKATLVPYRGASQAWPDIMAGRLDLLFDSDFNAVPHIKAANAKAYAVVGEARISSLPNVPTFRELGIPALDQGAWTALFAPRKTPKATIGQLTDLLDHALHDKAFQSRARTLGNDVTLEHTTPRTFDPFVAAEVQRWKVALKEVLPSRNP